MEVVQDAMMHESVVSSYRERKEDARHTARHEKGEKGDRLQPGVAQQVSGEETGSQTE